MYFKIRIIIINSFSNNFDISIEKINGNYFVEENKYCICGLCFVCPIALNLNRSKFDCFIKSLHTFEAFKKTYRFKDNQDILSLLTTVSNDLGVEVKVIEHIFDYIINLYITRNNGNFYRCIKCNC